MSGVELFALPALLGGGTVTLAGAATAVGAGLSAVSALSQGAAANSAAKYNAALYERNARITEQNAQMQEDRQRRLAAMRAGANRAAIGASGITAEGSALDLLESNAAQEELDALMIRWNGQTAAGDLRANAQLQRSAGRTAMFNGFAGAGSALLLGGTRAAGMLRPPSASPFAMLPGAAQGGGR
jgi:hypothetical protein